MDSLLAFPFWALRPGKFVIKCAKRDKLNGHRIFSFEIGLDAVPNLFPWNIRLVLQLVLTKLSRSGDNNMVAVWLALVTHSEKVPM